MSVTDAMRNKVAACFLDVPQWMGVGIDPDLTPTTTSMTDLVNPLVRVRVTSQQVNNAIQYTAKFSNLPPCEITEMGLFENQTGQTLLARWITKALKPNANNELEVVWTMQMD